MHDAPTCLLCPYVDGTIDGKWMGASWCNGDCEWKHWSCKHKPRKLERNNQIGLIESFGPTFRVEIDIIVHSNQARGRTQSILRFSNTNHNDYKMGDRIPALLFNTLYKIISIDHSSRSIPSISFDVDYGKWYHIEIAQTKVSGWNGKVSEIHDFSLLM